MPRKFTRTRTYCLHCPQRQETKGRFIRKFTEKLETKPSPRNHYLEFIWLILNYFPKLLLSKWA